VTHLSISLGEVAPVHLSPPLRLAQSRSSRSPKSRLSALLLGHEDRWSDVLEDLAEQGIRLGSTGLLFGGNRAGVDGNSEDWGCGGKSRSQVLCEPDPTDQPMLEHRKISTHTPSFDLPYNSVAPTSVAISCKLSALTSDGAALCNSEASQMIRTLPSGVSAFCAVFFKRG
jgi:hypothetical protein